MAPQHITERLSTVFKESRRGHLPPEPWKRTEWEKYEPADMIKLYAAAGAYCIDGGVWHGLDSHAKNKLHEENKLLRIANLAVEIKHISAHHIDAVAAWLVDNPSFQHLFTDLRYIAFWIKCLPTLHYQALLNTRFVADNIASLLENRHADLFLAIIFVITDSDDGKLAFFLSLAKKYIDIALEGGDDTIINFIGNLLQSNITLYLSYPFNLLSNDDKDMHSLFQHMLNAIITSFNNSGDRTFNITSPMLIRLLNKELFNTTRFSSAVVVEALAASLTTQVEDIIPICSIIATKHKLIPVLPLLIKSLPDGAIKLDVLMSLAHRLERNILLSLRGDERNSTRLHVAVLQGFVANSSNRAELIETLITQYNADVSGTKNFSPDLLSFLSIDEWLALLGPQDNGDIETMIARLNIHGWHDFNAVIRQLIVIKGEEAALLFLKNHSGWLERISNTIFSKPFTSSSANRDVADFFALFQSTDSIDIFKICWIDTMIGIKLFQAYQTCAQQVNAASFMTFCVAAPSLDQLRSLPDAFRLLFSQVFLDYHMDCRAETLMDSNVRFTAPAQYERLQALKVFLHDRIHDNLSLYTSVMRRITAQEIICAPKPQKNTQHSMTIYAECANPANIREYADDILTEIILTSSQYKQRFRWYAVSPVCDSFIFHLSTEQRQNLLAGLNDENVKQLLTMYLECVSTEKHTSTRINIVERPFHYHYHSVRANYREQFRFCYQLLKMLKEHETITETMQSDIYRRIMMLSIPLIKQEAQLYLIFLLFPSAYRYQFFLLFSQKLQELRASGIITNLQNFLNADETLATYRYRPPYTQILSGQQESLSYYFDHYKVCSPAPLILTHNNIITKLHGEGKIHPNMTPLALCLLVINAYSSDKWLLSANTSSIAIAKSLQTSLLVRQTKEDKYALTWDEALTMVRAAQVELKGKRGDKNGRLYEYLTCLGDYMDNILIMELTGCDLPTLLSQVRPAQPASSPASSSSIPTCSSSDHTPTSHTQSSATSNAFPTLDSEHDDPDVNVDSVTVSIDEVLSMTLPVVETFVLDDDPDINPTSVTDGADDIESMLLPVMETLVLDDDPDINPTSVTDGADDIESMPLPVVEQLILDDDSLLTNVGLPQSASSSASSSSIPFAPEDVSFDVGAGLVPAQAGRSLDSQLQSTPPQSKVTKGGFYASSDDEPESELEHRNPTIYFGAS